MPVRNLRKMANKEIRSIRIEPADGGGHVVTHDYKMTQHEGKHGLSESYVEPEHHVFGPGDGHAMLAHVANHLAIPEAEGAEEESQETPEVEAKSHSASFLKAALKDKGRMTPEKAKSVREKAA
jgi:hypothetical protein